MRLDEIKKLPKIDTEQTKQWFRDNGMNHVADKIMVNERYAELHVTDSLNISGIDVNIPYYFKMCTNYVDFRNCGMTKLPFNEASMIAQKFELEGMTGLTKLGKDMPGLVGALSIVECHKLKTIERLPAIIGANNYNFLTEINDCESLSSINDELEKTAVLRKLPNLKNVKISPNIEKLVIRKCGSLVLDLNITYSKCQFVSLSLNDKIRSMKGINKAFPNVERIVIDSKTTHVLGLFKIKSLTEIFVVDENEKTNQEAQDILQRGITEQMDLINIQQELIDAGFEDMAQL